MPKKDERLEKYHNEMMNNSFDHDSWKLFMKYFKICNNYNIPFSTLDQLRAIVGSSMVLAKAFLLLGFNYNDTDEFLQIVVPKIENDLGFRFHWVNRGDWHTAIDENYKFIIAQDWFLGFKNKNNIFEEGINKKLLDLIIDYFTYSNLSEILGYLNGQRLQSIETISNSILQDVRAQLGAKVLNELPKNIPGTIENYGIPVDGHKQIKLLLKSPIAAAESIAGVEKDKSIWSCKEFAGVIRRNMQYSQYLSPEFYKKVLIYTIGKLN